MTRAMRVWLLVCATVLVVCAVVLTVHATSTPKAKVDGKLCMADQIATGTMRDGCEVSRAGH